MQEYLAKLAPLLKHQAEIAAGKRDLLDAELTHARDFLSKDELN
jgi:hypothetical protein